MIIYCIFGWRYSRHNIISLALTWLYFVLINRTNNTIKFEIHIISEGIMVCSIKSHNSTEIVKVDHSASLLGALMRLNLWTLKISLCATTQVLQPIIFRMRPKQIVHIETHLNANYFRLDDYI